MSNIKILRLNNCGNNSRISQDADKSGFKYLLSQDLINNGRCMVEVVSGWSQITLQTLNAQGDVQSTERIIPNNIPQLVIRSNIIQEGEDTLTGGAGQILGTMSLENTKHLPDASNFTSNSAAFNQTEALTFITEQLPSQIHLQRLYWTNDTNDFTTIPTLAPANNIIDNPDYALLPFEVVLKLTFLDMQ